MNLNTLYAYIFGELKNDRRVKHGKKAFSLEFLAGRFLGVS